MRDVAINLRAESEQRDLIDRAASLSGRNRSDFMLEAACEKAREVLLERTFFALGDEQFGQFMALLDAPMEPGAGLTALLAKKPMWDA